ncbi:MAG: hypothetical protein QXP70_00870 [Methanomassiliicoccales archaeon]
MEETVRVTKYSSLSSITPYIAGSIFGVLIGLIDVYFPSRLHDFLYYFAIYSFIFIFAVAVAITYYSEKAAVPLGALGIASISMGFWAIAWTLYYYTFHYNEWFSIFMVKQSIGIGLGIYVPISIYIFSTILQSAGGGILIFISSPSIHKKLMGWVRSLLSD